MRFPVTLDVGDRAHKMKRVVEFLSKGHKVKVDVFVKGRLPLDKAAELLKEIRAELIEYKTLEEYPMRMGRDVSMTFLPK
jgi:translation initiation factor IF-3